MGLEVEIENNFKSAVLFFWFMSISNQPFIRKYSYLVNMLHLWLASTRWLQTLEFMLKEGARVQNLGHLKISFLNPRNYLAKGLHLLCDF